MATTRHNPFGCAHEPMAMRREGDAWRAWCQDRCGVEAIVAVTAVPADGAALEAALRTRLDAEATAPTGG